jgi:hypothetical protein
MSVVTRLPGQPITRRTPPGPARKRSCSSVGRRILLGAVLAFVVFPLMVDALFPLQIRFFLSGCPTGYVQLAGRWHYVTWNPFIGAKLNFDPIDCDIDTFHGLETDNGPFATDRHGAFVRHERIPGADVATFAPFTEPYMYGYSRDARHVYCRTEIVEQADPATFRHHNNDYNRDSTRLYHHNRLIAGADPDTWRVLEYTGYAVDRLHVFLRDKLIAHADPQTFEPILDENNWNTSYARDVAHVYRDCAIVDGADPATFHVLVTDRPPDFQFWADREHVFLRGQIVPNADAATFVPPRWKN